MTDIVITDAARTPHGKLLGALSGVGAVDLGVAAVEGLLGRTMLDPGEVDHVSLGNATQAGLGQVPGRQVARNALLDATPATTVNEASGSGLRALTLAADRITAGRAKAVVGGGFESMSNAPHLVPGMRKGVKHGDVEMVDAMIRDALWDMFYDMHMGDITEDFNEAHGIGREAQDRYSLESHERAVRARKKELFDDEIVPVETRNGVVDQDEGPRPDTSMDKLSALNPAFRDDGTITAGNASGLSDGAAAVMTMSREAAEEHGLDPMAAIRDYAVAYRDPKEFPLAIEDAVEVLLERNDLTVDDIDLFELNEAFASHMVHFMREMDIPREKLNARGGAVALGHPIGASGGILTTTLVHAMEDEDARFGIVGMCVGGGGGICMLLER